MADFIVVGSKPAGNGRWVTLIWPERGGVTLDGHAGIPKSNLPISMQQLR